MGVATHPSIDQGPAGSRDPSIHQQGLRDAIKDGAADAVMRILSAKPKLATYTDATKNTMLHLVSRISLATLTNMKMMQRTMRRKP